MSQRATSHVFILTVRNFGAWNSPWVTLCRGKDNPQDGCEKKTVEHFNEESVRRQEQDCKIQKKIVAGSPGVPMSGVARPVVRLNGQGVRVGVGFAVTTKDAVQGDDMLPRRRPPLSRRTVA